MQERTNMKKSISEIEKEVKNKEAKVARLMYLEELKLSDYIKDHDIVIIEEEMTSIQNELKLKTEKKLSELDNFLDSFDLEYEKIENAKFEYLYQDFIVKNEITMFAAPPSSGKSLISVALCNLFLLNKRINQIIYFDADNGTATLKERNIHNLKKKWLKQFRYFHESQVTKAQMLQIIKQLQKTDLKDVLIIFDSIKNFMIGGDRDKNRDVSKVMEVLKSLRARGATVLFLHHTNKPNKDLQELIYAGSSAFQEDSGNAYIMHQNEYKQSFIFKNFKKRTGILIDIAFTYGENHTLNQVDFIEANETEEDEQIRTEIVAFIDSNPRCIYSQILQHVTSLGYSKDKVNKVIQAGKTKYWEAVKNKTKQNRDEYILIKYLNDQDNSDNTSSLDTQARHNDQIAVDYYSTSNVSDCNEK